ncbi:TetR/AcrR family transcriptional regulator [Humibacter sp. BT305]|nr:TetR/AcrR family transcriptional regulator [Humibacter sp. BT305]
MTSAPRTARGARTRAALLEAAEHVFAELGYADASVVRITERAGVAQGTFYLYFDSKLDLFDELVDDLNRRVRRAMSEASAAAPDRLSAERAGFRAFFAFTAEHPALYRIIRAAEFVSPRALHRHYDRIVEGYAEGLAEAQRHGEVRPDLDPDVAAWALMGIGELVGMRWVLWERDAEGGVPDHVLDQVALLVDGAIGRRTAPATTGEENGS